MHRDLVEKRKWINEDDYKEGGACAISAWAFSRSMAIYIGYIDYKIIGATLAGLAICGYPLSLWSLQ